MQDTNPHVITRIVPEHHARRRVHPRPSAILLENPEGPLAWGYEIPTRGASSLEFTFKELITARSAIWGRSAADGSGASAEFAGDARMSPYPFLPTAVSDLSERSGPPLSNLCSVCVGSRRDLRSRSCRTPPGSSKEIDADWIQALVVIDNSSFPVGSLHGRYALFTFWTTGA